MEGDDDGARLDLGGWFSDDEGRWYADLAGSIAPGGTLVVVGAWKGRSASWAGPVCTARGVRFVLVDHFRGSTDEYSARYRESLARQDVRAILEANLGALGVTYDLLVLDSVAAARSFAPGSLDAVFLDASHDEAAVASDLGAWHDRVRPGGTLAGHDWSDEHAGLRDALERFAAARGLRVQRGPNRIWYLG
jgi:hypothetical protein